jgi:hypothetical protein
VARSTAASAYPSSSRRTAALSWPNSGGKRIGCSTWPSNDSSLKLLRNELPASV